MGSTNSKNKNAAPTPAPAVLTATTTPPAPTPTPNNWAELVQTQGDLMVKSKKHPKYPNSPSDDLLTHGNNSYTRLLVISSNKAEDEKRVEGIKKDAMKKADRVEYFVLPIPDIKNKKHEFITEVKQLRPTMFVLKAEDVLDALGESGLIEDWGDKDFWQLTEASDGNLFYKAKNITPKEQELMIKAFSVVSDGRGVEEELKQLLMQNKADIPNNNKTKILLLTGTHGAKGEDGQRNTVPFMGKSGLSTEKYLNQVFYAEDCRTVGIEANPSQFDAKDKYGDFLRWKSSGFSRPDIHTPHTPLTPLPSNSLLNDNNFNQMAFKILNLANYHNSPDLRGDSPDKVAKRCAKFMEDVKAYNPTIIFLCYCFSANGDIAMALRSERIYSEKILEHELRKISGNPEAKLHPTQLEVIRNVWQEGRKHVVLAGNSGVGKTVLGAAAVKDGAAIIKRNNADTNVKIYIVCMALGDNENAELLKILQEKYYVGLEGFEIVFGTPEKIAKVLGVNSEELPDDRIGQIKAICNKAEEKSDGGRTVSLMMFDEVYIDSDEDVHDYTGLEDLAKLSSVQTVTCVSPEAGGRGNTNFTVKLPATSDAQGHPTKFYCQVMTVGYRNGEEIRTFNNFLRHYQGIAPLLSRENDSLGAFLPPGPAGKHAVTWVQVEKVEDLGRAARGAVQECGQDVVVLHDGGSGSDSKEAAEASGAHKDKVMSADDFTGCEAKEVIFVTNYDILPEATSRAMERLVIVTGQGLYEDAKAVLNMAKDTRHTYIHEGGVKCEKNPCPFSDERFSGKFPLIEHKVFNSE